MHFEHRITSVLSNLSRSTQTHLCEDCISAFELVTGKNLQSLCIKIYVRAEPEVCFSLAGFFGKVQPTESRMREE